MLEKYFAELIQCAGTVYLAISIFIALIKAPSDETYKLYRTAKGLLAAAFAAMALNLFAWCILTNNDWAQFNYYIASTDIILFYLEDVLLCYAFCTLLNRKYITKRRLAIDTSLWTVTAVIASAATLDSMTEYRNILTLVSLALLIAYIVRFIYSFYIQYFRNKNVLENYFTDDMLHFAKWIKRSVCLLCLSWCIAITTMFGNIYFNWLYQFYVISLNIYIAVSFINFSRPYAKLSAADTESETTNMSMMDWEKKSDDTSKPFGNKLEAWIGTKAYLSQQFTIEDIATILGTNKNYLSYYINEKYGVNFSVWICKLRLAEAKKQMQDLPNKKLEDIAFSVGFSSASYFSKVFSLHEGISPARWRQKKIKDE